MALTPSYVGTSTIGASALTLVSNTGYYKKVTLAAGDYLASVEVYLNTDAAAPVSFKTVVYADNGGVPGRMIVFMDAHPDLVQFTGTPRWVALPVGYHSPAGEDVWVGFAPNDPDAMTLAYETTGGNDYQVVGSWTSEAGAYGTNTDPGSHLYSIRARIVSGFTVTRPGRTTVGGSWLSMGWGPIYLRSITIPANGTLASVAAHIRHSVANVVTFCGFVFDDNAGAPGKMLHAGQPGITASMIVASVGRWFHMPVGLAVTASTTVWVGIQLLGSTSFDLAYDASGSDGGTLASADDAAVWTAGDDSYSIHGVVLT